MQPKIYLVDQSSQVVRITMQAAHNNWPIVLLTAVQLEQEDIPPGSMIYGPIPEDFSAGEAVQIVRTNPLRHTLDKFIALVRWPEGLQTAC